MVLEVSVQGGLGLCWDKAEHQGGRAWQVGMVGHSYPLYSDQKTKGKKRHLSSPDFLPHPDSPFSSEFTEGLIHERN